MGAYFGILTALTFASAEQYSAEEDGTDGWVPVEETTETADDEWL